MKHRIGCMVCVAMLLIASNTSAQVPRFISYQGYAAQAGVALEGTHQVKLALYPDSLGYEVLYKTTDTLGFSGGIFNVQIGPIPNGFDFNKTLYLGISIDGAFEMSPRSVLLTSPYAFYSLDAAHAVLADSATKANHAVTADVIANFSGLPSGSLVTFTDDGDHAGFSYTGVASPPGNSWSLGPSSPDSDYGMTSAVVGNKIYIMGGGTGKHNRNLIYDPVVKTWDSGAVLPTGEYGNAIGAVGGKIYVIGGHFGTQNAVQIYDPSNNGWTDGALMRYPLDGMLSAVLNGKIYVLAGLGTYRNLNQIYDPATDTWSSGTNVPDAAAYFATTACACNGKIYLFGTSTDIYDPATNKWSNGAVIPLARAGFTSVAAGGKIYVFGGGSAVNAGTLCEVYDPATNKWSALPASPACANTATSAFFGGKIYVFGGNSGAPFAGLANIQIYTPPFPPRFLFTKN